VVLSLLKQRVARGQAMGFGHYDTGISTVEINIGLLSCIFLSRDWVVTGDTKRNTLALLTPSGYIV
jgi:hypothetical protein